MQSISPLVSNIAKVEFEVGQLSDAHTNVLKGLKNVRPLILKGDALLDEALNDIARMQQLEHLTLDSGAINNEVFDIENSYRCDALTSAMDREVHRTYTCQWLSPPAADVLALRALSRLDYKSSGGN